MSGTYTDFLHDLAVKESAGGTWNGNQINYTALGDNGTNYLGAYQFDEWTMNNLGYYKNDGNMNNPIDWQQADFTGKNGINSMQDFLNNPGVQNDAARHWFNDYVWQWVKQAGLDSYIGQTVDGIKISATGLLAGAHLLGVDSVQQFLQTGHDATTDPFGTPASLYLKMFSDYTSPFDPGGPGTDPYVVNGTVQPRNYSGSGIDTDGDNGNQGTVPGHTGPIDTTPMPYLHGTDASSSPAGAGTDPASSAASGGTGSQDASASPTQSPGQGQSPAGTDTTGTTHDAQPASTTPQTASATPAGADSSSGTDSSHVGSTTLHAASDVPAATGPSAATPASNGTSPTTTDPQTGTNSASATDPTATDTTTSTTAGHHHHHHHAQQDAASAGLSTTPGSQTVDTQSASTPLPSADAGLAPTAPHDASVFSCASGGAGQASLDLTGHGDLSQLASGATASDLGTSAQQWADAVQTVGSQPNDKLWFKMHDWHM